jgi:hypothetical protein
MDSQFVSANEVRRIEACPDCGHRAAVSYAILKVRDDSLAIDERIIEDSWVCSDTHCARFRDGATLPFGVAS